MATATLTPSPAPRPHRRFTTEEYHRLIDIGMLTKRDRCELIRGQILEKPPINPPHATAVSKLTKALVRMFGLDAVIRVQSAITLPPDSEPQPDIVVAAGADDDYETRHPGPKDILLVVEVADSSLPDDQSSQLSLYAAAKLPVYWIINIPDRQVEVYTHPRGGKNPTYRSRQDYGPADAVPVILGGRPLGTIPVREVLPR